MSHWREREVKIERRGFNGEDFSSSRVSLRCRSEHRVTTAQMLQRCIHCVALQPSSWTDVGSQRGLKSTFWLQDDLIIIMSWLTAKPAYGDWESLVCQLFTWTQSRITSFLLFIFYSDAVNLISGLHRFRCCSYGCCSSCLGLLTCEKHLQQQRKAKEAQRGGEEAFQAACTLLLFDHYIIASHAAPTVHSWSHTCACAASSLPCRWCVSDQHVADQSVAVHPAGGDLVLGHLCYERCPQTCQPGGDDGAPHCQLSRYALSPASINGIVLNHVGLFNRTMK